MTNPQTVEDYGLSMTKSELLEFDEGRELVAAILDITDDRIDTVANMIGKKVKQEIDLVSYGVLIVHTGKI